jgi:uncharacterized integral membrane protein (TIGR00698 family)
VNAKVLFFVGLILAASGFISTPVALLAGLVLGLSVTHPYQNDAKKVSSFLLQASVVALGFGMNLHEVLRAGEKGFLYTAVSITVTVLLGLGFGRLFKVAPNASLLISAGTAICGGSAIAAVGPVLNASEEEMAVSLGTVFILNSVALLTFPAIGWAMHLTQRQFGLWSALAIHDTSSVVGAAAKYGAVSLVVGTTVKLARALWIVPLTIAVAIQKKSKSPVKWPWFVFLFCLAAIVSSYVTAFRTVYDRIYVLGRIGLTVTLYMIGSGISRPMLKQVGMRPLVLGLVLWILVAVVSFIFIWKGLVSI